MGITIPRLQCENFDKVADYEAKAGYWLAEGNEWAELGNKTKAEKCYAKAQYWHDKSTKARGWN